MSVVTLNNANPQCQVFVTLSRDIAPGETLTAVSGDTSVVGLQGAPIASGTQGEVHFLAVGPTGRTTVTISVESAGVAISSRVLDVEVTQKIGATPALGLTVNPVVHN